MDSVQTEIQRYRDRRKKPWAQLRKRADRLRKAARTLAGRGDLQQCAGLIYKAAGWEMEACKLESAAQAGRASTQSKSSSEGNTPTQVGK